MENREAKQICLGSWYWWVWGGHKERVEEGEYVLTYENKSHNNQGKE
jgi:hypothetical protein